jgi:transcriptional regulator with XRE-family HTH domain
MSTSRRLTSPNIMVGTTRPKRDDVDQYYRIEDLGPLLRRRRRELRRSLRDLADEIDVSFNTLSRVERGHVPDLKNFRKIVDWLGLPADAFLFAEEERSVDAPQLVARQLRADPLLRPEEAERIAAVVEEMYRSLVAERAPVLAVHLRSAKSFTPAAAAALADVLSEMRTRLEREERDGA